MRHWTIILIMLTVTWTVDVFGQNLKKAIFYLDGEEIKYKMKIVHAKWQPHVMLKEMKIVRF